MKRSRPHVPAQGRDDADLGDVEGRQVQLLVQALLHFYSIFLVIMFYTCLCSICLHHARGVRSSSWVCLLVCVFVSLVCAYIYIYIYIYTYTSIYGLFVDISICLCIYMYIYIYIEREGELFMCNTNTMFTTNYYHCLWVKFILSSSFRLKRALDK